MRVSVELGIHTRLAARLVASLVTAHRRLINFSDHYRRWAGRQVTGGSGRASNLIAL